MDKETWLRSGINVEHSSVFFDYFKYLPHNVLLGIAYDEFGCPQSGILGLYNSKMFYYLYGAGINHPVPGSSHLLQWATIKKMKQAGVQYYNFVGCRIDEDPESKYHSIQHYKQGFGGELRECYLFKQTIRKYKKNFFDLMMKIKNNGSPMLDIIDQELDKWKWIN